MRVRLRASILAGLLLVLTGCTLPQLPPLDPADPASPEPDKPSKTSFTIGPNSWWWMVAHMHQCDLEQPRLFQRAADVEIEYSEAFHEAWRRSTDNATLDAFLRGDLDAIEAWDTCRNIMSQTKKEYLTLYPEQGISDPDLKALKAFLRPGDKLTITKWQDPDPGFAHVGIAPESFDEGRTVFEVCFPTSPLSVTGYCDRSTVMHEMTHYCQLTLEPSHPGEIVFYDAFNNVVAEGAVFEPIELAAMIVEVAEKVRQGWTPEMFDRLASSDPVWTKFGHAMGFSDGAGMYHQIIPRFQGGLLVQMVTKYGPHFTGDMAKDLPILREWVRNFEEVGTLNFRVLPGAMDWGWAAQHQLDEGKLSHLSAAAQTWLGINGCMSWFPFDPGPNGLVQDSFYADQKPLDAAALEEMIDKMDAGTPEAKKRAKEFLERLRP